MLMVCSASSSNRTRYEQYNNDTDTRAMRESAPLIPVWDDHEYANNAYNGGAAVRQLPAPD
jgi:alkaline phosphatase D